MSQTAASLALAALLFGMAVYFFIVPPPGFDEGLMNRIVLPLLLVATAFGVMENLRTRTHMGQLIGAIRGLMGQKGKPATPEVKREAVDMLIKTLRSDNARAREAALTQLQRITSEDFGENPDAWDRWWSKNREKLV